MNSSLNLKKKKTQKGEMYRTQNDMFTTFTNVFKSKTLVNVVKLLHKHATLKRKVIRRN